MADLQRIEQVKAETVAAEIGRLIAADVHWMMQRFDIGGPRIDPQIVLTDNGPAGYADTRYTRLLRTMAEQVIRGLEQEASHGHRG